MLADAILAAHFALLALLCVYGARRILVTARRLAQVRHEPPPPGPWSARPVITVQLPVYNEKFVIERLIDACAALNYPRERLQIQVLDDSSDDTVALAAARVAFHRARGIDIEHRRRSRREGYKAGALAEGLRHARGEFIAIFDADFVPTPQALEHALAPFADPDVGLVQLRWEHLNRVHSSLTQAQAILLDAHFAIEQAGRSAAGLFLNFNGTAGLWRRRAIVDAGSWQADTLTEDLDLSYRAQLRGWRFKVLMSPACPAELPTTLNAFKAQQHRWAKGATQVMLKLLGDLWRAPLPLRVKIEAGFHLTANLGYLLMFLDCLLFLLPSIVIRYERELGALIWVDLPVLMFCSVGHVFYFLAGQQLLTGGVGRALRHVPALLSLCAGLALNNARAVIEALLGHASGFVRTPKLGEHAQRDQRCVAAYPALRSGWPLLMLELAVGLIYGGALAWAVAEQLWGALPILLLFLHGFLSIALRGLHERLLRSHAAL